MNTKKKYNLIQTLLLALTLLIVSPTITMAATTLKKENGNNHTIAIEVIRGDWGNGQKRKDGLTEAGYEYRAIQDIVNSYYGILYAVSSLMENSTAVKQNDTQETKQVAQIERSKKTASKKTESKKVTSEKVVNKKVVNKKVVSKKVVNKKTQSSRLYSLRDLQFHGVIKWKGYKFTYYSQRV